MQPLKKLLFLLLILSANTVLADPPVYLSHSSTPNTTGYAGTQDNQGNIFIAGKLEGDIDVVFNGKSQGYKKVSESANFIHKYSPDNKLIWSVVLEGHRDGLKITDMATDSQGNLYVTGTFYFHLKILHSGGADSIPKAYTSESFILRISPVGHVDFVKGILGDRSIASGVEIHNNQVHVAGTFSGNISIDGHAVNTPNYGFFFLQMGKEGNIINFSHPDWYPVPPKINDFKIDQNGNYYLTGIIHNKTTYKGTTGSFKLTVDSKNKTVYLIKLNPAYQPVFGFTLSGEGDKDVTGMALSDDGVYICGKYTGETGFSPDHKRYVRGETYGTGFIAKYDLDGHYQWDCPLVKNNQEYTLDYVAAIDVDKEGSVVCAYIGNPIKAETEKTSLAGEQLPPASRTASIIFLDKNGKPAREYTMLAYYVFEFHSLHWSSSAEVTATGTFQELELMANGNKIKLDNEQYKYSSFVLMLKK